MGIAQLGRGAHQRSAASIWRPLSRGLPAILLLTGLLICSCGEDEGGGGGVGPGLTAAELNDLGWEAFDAADYVDALSYFEQALELDDGLQDARLGLGWSATHTGDYELAVVAFDALIAAQDLVADAYAGRAAASLGIDPELAAQSAAAALDLSAEYVFAKRPEFNYLDLRLIMAEAYFALADYASAQAQVDILDPDNGLDPEAADYVDQLALVIEQLRELVAGELPE